MTKNHRDRTNDTLNQRTVPDTWQIVQNEDGSYLVELTKLSQEQYNDALEVLRFVGINIYFSLYINIL